MEKPKRFNFQEDPFVKERFNAVKDSVEELRQEYPEILSVNLFGSLVKGKTKEESDIDGIIYVDTDKIKSEKEIFTIREVDEKENKEFKTISIEMFLVEEFYIQYNKIVQDRILEKIPSLKQEQVNHIRSLPMSEDSLNQILDKLINSKKVAIDYEKKILSLHPEIRTREEFIKFSNDVEKPERLISTPRLLLGSMFLLEVGGGIRKYRKQLIERLLSSGDAGEYIWKDIISYVERWEQKVKYQDLPIEVHYPRSLEEAKSVFG